MPRRTQFIEVKLRDGKCGNSALPDVAARLPHFVGGPADAALKLSALRILIAGVGSLGGRIATHLERLAVAMLWLIDPKRFKSESLLTHEIERRNVGKSKALHTAQRCKAVSPATRVFAFDGVVEEVPLDAFAEADLVVLATDNLAAEIEVGQRCVRLGKPLIQASVHGDTLTAQVRIFGNADGSGPCPACGFGAVEWRMLNEQVRFSCEGSAATPTLVSSLPFNPPTISTSHLCSLGAGLAMNQILRAALRLGAPVLDTSVELCGFTNRCVTTQLKRNPDCPIDHGKYQVALAAMPLGRIPLNELARRAVPGAGDGPVTFSVDGFRWVQSGTCQCSAAKVVQRFVPVERKQIGHCAKCGSPILAQPLFTHRTVAAALLGDALEQPLERLGATKARCVLVSNGDQSVLIRDHNAEHPAS